MRHIRSGSLHRLLACSLLLFLLSPCASIGEEEPAASTNGWTLSSDEYLESISFIIADSIDADGRAYDDVFWLASGHAELNGQFDNDVWLLASQSRLNGTFADHARVLGSTIQVNGIISNGLWAAGTAITAATNSTLYGDHLLYGDHVTLIGHIEGNVLARAQRITLGGTIVGNLRLHADDIIIRPGTTIVGDLTYVTTNQTIVLDPRSNISGHMDHIKSETAHSLLSPQWSAMLELYFFGAALLVGIPFVLIFPAPVGRAVRLLQVNMIKCGLVGLLFILLVPLLIFLSMFSLLGIPLAFALGASYGLLLYLGKFIAAFALGVHLFIRRGRLTAPGAILSLVAGLFVYYSMALVPFIGGSLQTVAAAFGTGSLVLLLAAGRKPEVFKQSQTENSDITK